MKKPMIFWPFITKSHHEEVVTELKRQLSDSQAERKRVFDAYCASLGVPPLFSPKGEPLPTPEIEEEEDSQENVTAIRRPSQIVAQQSAKKQREFMEKYQPTAAAAADLDAAKRRGEALARS